MKANVIISTEMVQETNFGLASSRGAKFEAVDIKLRCLPKKELTWSQVNGVFWLGDKSDFLEEESIFNLNSWSPQMKTNKI